MNQLFGGSICLTDLIDKAKAGHSAFTKATNGKVYFNVITWLNDRIDDYGNCMSHQLSSTKEKRDKEGKFYIGNSRRLESNMPVTANDIPNEQFNNVRQTNQPATDDNADDLPF